MLIMISAEHIDAFNNKIINEAPQSIKTQICDMEIKFSLLENFTDEDSLLEYDVILHDKRHVLQIQYWCDDDNPNHHRIEVRTPNLRSYQITCFHCKTVGLLSTSGIVEIEQVVKVSGQPARNGLDVQETNKKIKEQACLLLKQEGLLLEQDKKASHWHIGTYDSRTKKWLHGQTTSGFIGNFLKVALIMAHCRGNRGIDLFLNTESQSQTSEPDDLQKGLSPEDFKKKREKWEYVGLLGEEFVLEMERRRLIESGRGDLAEGVQHVSLYNCGAGYDIKSYELDGRPRYIECKTSVGDSMRFEVTRNEWDRAKKYRAQYYLYRIVNIENVNTRNVIIIQDPFGKFEDGELNLKPSTFTVTFE